MFASSSSTCLSCARIPLASLRAVYTSLCALHRWFRQGFSFQNMLILFSLHPFICFFFYYGVWVICVQQTGSLHYENIYIPQNPSGRFILMSWCKPKSIVHCFLFLTHFRILKLTPFQLSVTLTWRMTENSISNPESSMQTEISSFKILSV